MCSLKPYKFCLKHFSLKCFIFEIFSRFLLDTRYGKWMRFKGTRIKKTKTVVAAKREKRNKKKVLSYCTWIFHFAYFSVLSSVAIIIEDRLQVSHEFKHSKHRVDSLFSRCLRITSDTFGRKRSTETDVVWILK